MSFTFVWLLAVALAATVLTMPIARWAGTRVGLLDRPQARKVQTRPVPRAGGIGVLFGLAAGSTVLLLLAHEIGVPINREIVAIFWAAVVIHATGVLDDLLDLAAPLKLGAQSLAVVIVISQGVVLDRIVLPNGIVWELGILSVPLTGFFLLGFVNAINLVDGLDGLAGGIVAIGALALAMTGVLEGNYVLASLATILLGAVLGFLPFNFARDKTFLGDAGSMLLGFLLGVTAIAGARFGASTTSVFVVLACAVMPILDTATTILRRSRRRQKLFHADSMHIHHRMIRFGLSPRATVLVILSTTLFAATQGMVLFVEGTKALGVVSALAGLLVIVQLRGQRKSLAETDSSFREILFYLLGAQDGRCPRTRGEVDLAEVLAIRTAALTTENGNGSVPEPVTAPVGGDAEAPLLDARLEEVAARSK